MTMDELDRMVYAFLGFGVFCGVAFIGAYAAVGWIL
jgi:hypothetical protein